MITYSLSNRRITVASALVLAMLLGVWAWPGAAAPPSLSLPIDCVPGETCWIVNYVDDDQDPGWQDYRCGQFSYDGHKGTDFAIRDLAVMREGIPVIAAAPGKVRSIRDGMADKVAASPADREALQGKDCGNGVVIDHPDGWSTQYCHMRQGSVAVKPGQEVKRAQVLGLVGLSGLTEFPHVHLQVANRGVIVDPFVGVGGREQCALGRAPLWDNTALALLPYGSTWAYNYGFAGERPKEAKARNGDYRVSELTRRSGTLYLWVDLFNILAGDRVTLSIIGPDGATLVKRTIEMNRTQARRFMFAERPLKGRAWPTGVYEGEVRVDGKDGNHSRHTTQVTVR